MRKSFLRPVYSAALGASFLSIAGCDLVLGLGDYKEGNGTGGKGGAAATSNSTGDGSTTGSMGTTSSSGSGSSSSGMTTCSPGMDYDCYDGPPGTQNVGECREGTHTCKADGETYTPCVQQILPASETCKDDKKDEDCDEADCVLDAHAFGDASDQTIAGVATDAMGNVFIAGTFKGTLALDPAKPLVATSTKGQIYLAKFDPAGAPLWSKAFASTEAVSVSGLAVDGTGAVVFTGTFSAAGSLTLGTAPVPVMYEYVQGYYAKFDASGNHVFNGAAGTNEVSQVAAPAIDAAGNIYIWSSGSCQSACNDSNFSLVKRSSSNTVVWSKSSYQGVFSSAPDYSARVARGVAVDAAGNVYVAGGFKGAEVLGGGTAIASAGGLDGIIGKFNSSGALLNKWRYGDAADQTAGPIAIDSASNVYIATTFKGSATLPSGTTITSTGGSDTGVFQLGSNGVFGWSKRFGDSADQVAAAIAVGNGQVVLASTTLGNVDYGGGVLTSTGGTDVALVKMDAASGFYLWSRLFGDSGTQVSGSTMSITTTGRTTFGTTFGGAVDLGAGPITSAGANDLVFATLAP